MDTNFHETKKNNSKYIHIQNTFHEFYTAFLSKSPLLDMVFRVPKKKAGPDYKYHEVVRKRHERQKLEAYTCYQCEEVRIIKLQIVHFFRFLCT